MATVTSAGLKKFGDAFSNERWFKKLTYDFASDGGESDDVIRIGQASAKCVVVESRVVVETAATSGGSATVAIGVEGGDVDAILDISDGAVANLTADAVLYDVITAEGFVMDADEWIIFDIATADLTAGKVHVYISGFNAA